MSSTLFVSSENGLSGPISKTDLVESQIVDTSESKVPGETDYTIVGLILTVIVTLVTVGIAWGTLKGLVQGIKDTLDKDVKPDLKNVRERFSIVEDRVDTIWKDRLAPAHSPRQLNEKGRNVLENSGIKKIIDEKKDILLDKIKKRKPKTAYDAEIVIDDVVSNLLKHCPDMTDRLKKGAFNVGQSIDVVLFVGSIYLRNLIFKDLGFSLTDLDKKK